MKLMGGAAALVPGLAPDPLFFAYLVGLCELIGRLAIVLGYPVRTVGILLGLWCLATAKQAHMAM
ncbi:DoxX family membrane protein [Sphingobium olei]|uniref:DoxX family membrane protein n=1 Tax=Sphingobium olei TaxID=420955 RepID=A0ABW3NT66_9SPHN